MNRLLLFCLALLAAACSREASSPTIEYQGEHFRLTRHFADYDEFKEAPNNIDTNEFARIEAKILSVEIAKEFKTKQALFLAALKIKFPDYGFGGVDSKENIYNATIEIPGRNADRYITAIEKNGRWLVVDDFKGSTAYGGSTVEMQSGQLIYKTHEGKEFRRTPLL